MLTRVVDDITSYRRDADILETLKNLAAKLKEDSNEVKIRLEATDPNTGARRIVFALTGETGLRELLSQIETHAGSLLTWLHLLDLRASLQATVADRKLPQEVLMCHGSKTSIRTAPRLYTIDAEYKPLATVEKLEVVVLADEANEKAINEVAGLLSQRIGSAGGGYATGILPCLGYQDNRLMFRLPQNAKDPQTLRATIWHDAGCGRVAALGQRFDLAQQLADVVFMIHTANLMHKNLRGDTVLLLRPTEGVEMPTDLPIPTGDGDDKGESPEQTAKSEKEDPVIEERPPNFLGKVKRRFSSRSRQKDKKSADNDNRRESPPPPSPSPPPPSPTPPSPTPPSPTPPGRFKQTLPRDSIAVLTHWSEAKRHGETSDRAGPAENDWHIKVYRHPSQQDTHTRTAYNFGHDIYALGVCLLEIGLWRPLVQPLDAAAERPVASTRLLLAGAVATVEILEKRLKEALERGGDRPKAVVVSVLKEEAGIAAAYQVRKALDDLEVNGNGEAGRETIERLRKEVDQALREERYHGASYRLKGALVEVLMDKALGDQEHGNSTLSTAKLLRRAVKAAVKDRRVKESVTATASRLKTAAERLEHLEGIEALVMDDAKKAMDSAVKEVKEESGIGANIFWIALRLEQIVNEVQELERNNLIGPEVVGLEIAKRLEMYATRNKYRATEEELNSLLKDNGGEALSRALVGLAEERLPSAMGVLYTRLVVNCLTWLEGGFDDHNGASFEGISQEEACITLERQIVAPLRRVNLGE
ncbi:hypothetical protein B0J18DRAFT_299295 [Chaetomium sp. MPI-SDFR-AT-0129]|nr:hypothetical protein B0J18DRAFT_299295 [Chaetomium sp. MPI-SDFR-AT-0129]